LPVAEFAEFGRRIRENAQEIAPTGPKAKPCRIPLEKFREELRTTRESRRKTGIPTLDRATGGGLPGGSVATLVGPPGSVKTTLGIQLVKDRARDLIGIAYVYACDQGGRQPLARLAETFGDIVTSDVAFERFREDCSCLWVVDEAADGATLEAFESLVLESADQPADRAAAVLIDTAQTVYSEEDDEERARIGKVYVVARRIAERLQIPVVVCSHANRSATAARHKEDRNLPRAAGLGSAAIEHRSQVLIFMEQVEGTERTETDCSIEKCTFGRSGARFRLVLDPRTWRLAETETAPVDEERLGEEIRAEHRHLDDEVFKYLEQRWMAGEAPCKSVVLVGFRAARQVQGRVGIREKAIAESIARLVADVRVNQEIGVRGAHVLTRPTVRHQEEAGAEVRPAPPTSAAAPPGAGGSTSASSADPRKGGGADGRRSECQTEVSAPPVPQPGLPTDEKGANR
jgi:KaiC/GvpD/RAD55 family RecA-like ATPase